MIATYKFKLIIILLLTPLVLTAAKKKKMQNIPAYEVTFSQHIASQQLELLIDDYNKYPELRERIKNYLFYEYDYHMSSLTLLNRLADRAASTDSIFARGMAAIVAEYKGQVLDGLSRMDYHQMGTYYKRTELDDHDFLQTIFRKVFLEQIDHFKYIDVKQLTTAFEGTDLSNDFKNAYEQRRTLAMSNLDKSLKEYAEMENLLAKDFKDKTLAEVSYLVDSLYDKINALVVQSFKTKSLVIGNQLADFKVKLTRIVQENLEDCQQCIMDGRKEFDKELFGGVVSVYTDVDKISSEQSEGFSFPVAEFENYAQQVNNQKQSQQDDETLDAILALTPLGWLGALADLAEAATPEKNRVKSKKKSPNYAEIFNKKLYDNMSSSANTYVEKYFDSLVQNINQSQKKFTSSIYENL
jgi:hypothetical protein